MATTKGARPGPVARRLLDLTGMDLFNDLSQRETPEDTVTDPEASAVSNGQGVSVQGHWLGHTAQTSKSTTCHPASNVPAVNQM